MRKRSEKVRLLLQSANANFDPRTPNGWSPSKEIARLREIAVDFGLQLAMNLLEQAFPEAVNEPGTEEGRA